MNRALRYHFAEMHDSGKIPFAPIAALVFALALSGCATTTTPPASETRGTGPAAAFARGNYGQAAKGWQQEALNASPRQAAKLRVSAADAWTLAGRTDNAEDILRWVTRKDLDSPDRARLDLVLADLALRYNRPDEAEQLLLQARPGLPRSSRTRYEDLKNSVLLQLSSPGARNLSSAVRLSAGMKFYDPAAAVELIRSLESMSSGELAIRADNPRGERQLTGWLGLALVIRRNLVVPDGIVSSIGEWKSRHPYHLLTEQQALDTWLSYRQLFYPPGKVAVLIPGTGRLKSAGEAIRDGLVSAYMDQPGGAEILFFATGDDEQSSIAAYFNALDAGADMIIGPLRKESVSAMLGLAGMSTPVLALNDLPPGFVHPPGLAGQVNAISLSQENEITAIADHAAASGFKKAMVIAPESAWGERMALAFESGFLHEDREIIAAARYPEAQNDHSATLERLLKIDESKARKRRLENTLQLTLEFEPVRRNDVDVIFMAANAAQARQIRPQLKFHDAGDIPVYATARAYSGGPDPARNMDLNGIRFPATPWQLTHVLAAEIPEFSSIRQGSLGTLFALGQDAWNILPWLALMQKDRDFSFQGQSGYYRSTATGSLKRTPAWAEFSRGRPVPLKQND
jgi:outer membrane PBP1 activator LpoA protein